jgi:radical SAM protein with 4Fe4S-binding SPASM domain
MQFEEPEKLVPEGSGLPKSLALRIPRGMKEAGIPSIELTGGGEPMVYPYLLEFLDELNKYDIELAIVTNGASLKESIQSRLKRLKWIRFSVDAITPETYAKVHRVPKSVFHVVLKHIREMVARRIEDCKVGISFVITENNYQEVAEAAPFFKKLGVNNVRFTFTYEPTGEAWLTPDQKKKIEESMMESRKCEDEKFKVFATMRRLEYYAQANTDFHFCGYQFFTWAIGYDGFVYPCCIMKYHKGYAMGDLRIHTLEELVYSQERRAFVEAFRVERCKPCWLRDKNQFIEYLIAEGPQHIDFV